jgi:hypothetical protein
MSKAYKLNERILLLAHVPFGINETLLHSFSDIQLEQKLLSIIDKYSSNIIMCLSGHHHHDTFCICSSLNVTTGILAHPSISPSDYKTPPSFRYYSYNRQSLIPTDYEQYSLNLRQTQTDQWLLSTKRIKLVYLIRNNSFYLKRFLLTKHYLISMNFFHVQDY